MRAGETITLDGKKYLVLGKSFGSSLKLKQGEVFELEGEQLNIERDKAGNISKVTVWAPEVMGPTDKKPESLQTIVTRARRHGVLREKIRKEDGSIEYVPNEPGNPATADKAKPNRSQCMNCKSPPVIDVHWADGRGRAWFCLPCFEKWIEEDEREIVRAWYIKDGEVPKKIGEGNSTQIRKLGEGLGQEQIVGQLKKFVADEDIKALEDYPDETKKLRYVVQVHFRGKSAHADPRFEYKRGKQNYLRGWTVSIQQPGAIKKPVTTMKDAERQIKNTRNWKMNLDTGIIKPRRIRGGVVRRGNLRAFPKGVEVPKDWIDVEGVTEEPDPGEPIPAGATRFFPGVFVIVAKGNVDWGAQKAWFNEFFLDGDWKGRWTFRLVKREKAKYWLIEDDHEAAELAKELSLKSVDELQSLPVSLKQELPPGVEEEDERVRAFWQLMQPLDATPYVLSREAIKKAWLPPRGISALPRKMRASVPKSLQYWTMGRAAALKARAELAEYEELGGTELKQRAAKFVLIRRDWRGQAVIRFGPSTKVWDLYITEPAGKVWRLSLQSDPLKDDEVAGSPERYTEVTGTDGKSHSVFDLKVGQIVDVKPGTPVNDTKETPCKLEVLDAGEAQELTAEKTMRKYDLKGKKLKGTWFFRAEEEDKPGGFWLMSKSGGPEVKEVEVREITVLVDDEQSEWLDNDKANPCPEEEDEEKVRGEGQGVGGPRQGNGTDKCVCPSCGKEFDHKRGSPCNKETCPKCGISLIGKAEMDGATASVGRSVVSTVASTLGSLIKKKSEDDKAGRRIRGDKVRLIEKLASEFEDFKQALANLLKWASYKDDNESIDESTDTFLDWLSGESGAKTFKTQDGETWLLTWTTNAFKDREGEIFTTKALEKYVARHEDADVKGQFDFWHVDGSEFADIKWQAMIGRFLAEAGPFKDNEIGTAFKEFFSNNPNGHPDIAPEGWGTSHKYAYDGQDREQDGVYNWFDKKKTTVLPLSAAANQHNPAPLMLDKEQSEMNDKQRNALRTILGDKLASEVERVGEKRTQELEASVDFKAEGQKQGKFAKAIRDVLGKIEDEAIRKQIESIAKALEGAYPKPRKQVEEEEEEEKPEKKEFAEDLKAAKLPDLAKRLRMLGGRVGGVVGDKLQKIAADILKFTKGEGYAKPTKADRKPEEEEEYPKPGRKDFEDIVESVKAITEHFSHRFDDVTEAVKSIAEAVAGLVTEVEALKHDDAEKVTKLVEDTPAASLKAMVQSVIGQKDAQVDGRSSLAKDKPKVTAPDDSAGGGSLGIFPKDWFAGPTAS